MGPMERKERERLALRARILDGARTLFAERGYQAVTMRTIAQAVEYSPRTLYLHFKDKEELMRALCLEDFQALGEGFAALQAIPDPLERLRASGLAYAAFAQAYPNHYKLMFMDRPAAPPSPEDLAAKPEVDAYAFVRTCAAEAQARGMLRPGWEDPDLAAQVIWGALHGVIALHVTHRDDPFVPWRTLEARIEGVIRMIQDGLRTP